jgi:hypothetical protein
MNSSGNYKKPIQLSDLLPQEAVAAPKGSNNALAAALSALGKQRKGGA